MTPPPPSGHRARRTLIAATLLFVAGMVLFVRLDAALKAGGVLRLAPPLIITEAEADEAVDLLDRACRRMTPSASKVAAK